MAAIDSSSLILMAKIDMLDRIINNVQKKLSITNKVFIESTSKTEAFDAKLINKRIKERIIEKKHIKNLKLYKKIKEDFNLGEGEAESIVYCMENKIGLITDDKKAMNACKILNIGYTTVPNLLVTIYKRGLISKIEASLYFKKLQKFGRYSREIIEKVEGELK